MGVIRMKKIEFVYPFELGSTFGGLETKQPERKIVYMAEVTWQDDSEDESEETVYPISGPLVAYTEDGFLAGDDVNWYFYDIDGNLVKEVAKAELGDCTEIGGFATGKEEAEINLYIFEKAGNNGRGNDSVPCFSQWRENPTIQFAKQLSDYWFSNCSID